MSFAYILFQILISSFLFVLSHPSYFCESGISCLGFFVLFPIFNVIKYLKINSAWLWGFLYGFICYAGLCFWLCSYSLIAFIFVLIACGLYMAILFEIFYFINKLFRFNSFYVMALVWCIYEYAKTKGFLGFPYGVLGYTQWNVDVFLCLAGVGGVWYASLFCALFSATLSSFVNYPNKKSLQQDFIFVPLMICVILFFSYSLFKGFSIRKNNDKDGGTNIYVVAVQNNTDSNKYDFASYKDDIKNLMTLTQKAFMQHKNIDFVVWPETAVVPFIVLNYFQPIDKSRKDLIYSLLDFLEQYDSCFVIGNPHRIIDDENNFYDYNSSLVFYKDNIFPPVPNIYSKIHLVPFTEYFPYKNIFPHLYKKLESKSDSLWERGNNFKVFKYNMSNERKISFSTPICFEDSFDFLCRKFVQKGAMCFFNLSNDSWSKSRTAQMQHLSMAVFRSAENYVPTIRSTASGVTCYINAKGHIVNVLPQFEQGFLYQKVFISERAGKTFYSNFGNWLPVLQIIILLIILMIKLVEINDINGVKYLLWQMKH